MNPRLLSWLGLALLIALSRWIPWSANFSPVYAIFFVMGMQLRSHSSLRFGVLAFAFIGLFMSDLAIGFYDGMAWVYAGYAAIVGFGCLIGDQHSSKRDWTRMGLGALGGSLAFFAASNFGVWLTGLMYPLTGEGLWICFVAALPFFEKTFVSMMIFLPVVVWLQKYLQNRIVQLASV